MATISEFKGLRPQKNLVDQIAVLPYDVISTEDARRITGENKLSFFHVSKPEIDFADSVDYQDSKVYNHGKNQLNKMIKDGAFLQDETPCLYLYTQIMDGREQTGLISCVSIDDYINKKIKKHELTREDKENDRTCHTDIINANTGQVFLFFKDTGSKKKLFSDAMALIPEYEYTSEDNVQQIIRIIKDKRLIEAFKQAFKNDVLYIADGHHRAAAAVRVGVQRRTENPQYTGSEEFNRFMAVIFPHSQLLILPYNRVIRDLKGNTKDELLQKISVKFSIEKKDKKKPEMVHEICMYVEKSWYVLKPNFTIESDPINNLDVKILQDCILEPIFGIKDPRKDKRIDFIGGKKSVTEIQRCVDSGEYAIAFSLFPTTLEQLMNVSDTDGVMPPKSTWFEPKLRSGIIVHLL